MPTKIKRKTMHLPPQTHEKIELISTKLKRPMVDVVDEMASATLRAIDRAPSMAHI